ncbi:MAG: TauD/TfdA family dioxygenase [Gammaproteobacteria bacterium]|nr:TauD/TfdA family dioxygenase [Gammaproteobacteria bacterium]
MNLKITPLTPAIGAEVGGVDLGADLPDSAIDELHRALCEHLVLFFRGQELTPRAHVEFARRFGELDKPHEVYPHAKGFDEITEFAHDGKNRADTDEWHTDLTFKANPPFAAVLHALEVPAVGGDTLWTSMCAAYDGLPDAVKEQLAPLSAVHDIGSFRNNLLGRDHDIAALNAALAGGSAVHKMVARHPVSGRRILYVNQSFTRQIIGMSVPDSDRLLQFLYSHANRPEFQVRFRWSKGAVAMWDNRATQHYAAADYADFRRMHRVTVVNDRRVTPET